MAGEYLDPLLDEMNPQASSYDPQAMAARRAAILKTLGMTPEERRAADDATAQQYQRASRRANFAGIAAGSAIPQMANMGKALGGEATKEQDRIMRYGPQAQVLNRAKAALGYLGKSEAAGAGIVKGQQANTSREGIAGANNASREKIAGMNNATKLEVARIKPGGLKILKDDDGFQYRITPEGAEKITDSDGTPIQLKRAMTTGEVNAVTGFESARNRLKLLKQAFLKGAGTYPGASTIHDLAQVVDAADPDFAALKTLAGGHLIKGMHADIGRVTDFDLRYGSHLFPTEADRTDVAMAKIAKLEQMMEEDEANYKKTLKRAGRKTPDAPKKGKYNPATGQVE